MDKSTLLLAGLICLSTAGCARHVDLKPEFSPSLNRQGYFDDCAHNIEVADARKRTSTYYKTLSREDAEKWLLGSLEYIRPMRISETNSDPLPILLSLEKAYIGHVATTKSGVVVIAAKQGDTQEYYRGRVTNINWWGPADEYHTALNGALEEALHQFARDKKFFISCSPREEVEYTRSSPTSM